MGVCRPPELSEDCESVDCWDVSSCMGCPSGPVVMSGAVTELVVAVADPGRESLGGAPPSLGVGVEEGGSELGVELGLG